MNPASEAGRRPDDTHPRACRGAYDEALRQAFTEAAAAVTPSPAPLAAIERAGRARRRRGNAAMLVAGCGLLLGPLAVVALHGNPPPDPVPVPVPVLTAGPPTPSPAAEPPRVVRPGQRVKAAPGAQVWLTEDGKHWSTEDQPDQFRSVNDGNLDLNTPGVSRQSETVGSRYFHSGVYYGTRDAARVELTTATGRTVRAAMLELAGEPGWGVWYATTELSSATAGFGPEGAGTGEPTADFIRGITLYDTAGKVLATL
ncbi:hypothetical protein ACFYYH_30465 [Streptomyces sp. NPDC002018]|uniref:hypothetical protein n=1 Tax=Streptomyces sp. NPDC002018 TaxID=3364629 RepID=UPI0036BF6807